MFIYKPFDKYIYKCKTNVTRQLIDRKGIHIREKQQIKKYFGKMKYSS